MVSKLEKLMDMVYNVQYLGELGQVVTGPIGNVLGVRVAVSTILAEPGEWRETRLFVNSKGVVRASVKYGEEFVELFTATPVVEE